MGARFEELDWQPTPLGEISLRRRVDPRLQVEVFEAKLDDEFLMSSLFTVAEVELARLGLARLAETSERDGGWEVLVGGLGLGYTARAVLEEPRVGSLVVVEALSEVVGWHTRGLLPESPALTADPRTRFVPADFFALARSEEGLDPDRPGRAFDAVLVDIDHTPRHVLHPSHADLYTPDGLRRVARRLRPGGVFALWSDDPPEDRFLSDAGQVFSDVEGHVVTFANPLTGGESANTVYVGHV